MFQFKLFLILSLFSDFEPRVPLKPRKPVKTISKKRSLVIPKCPMPPVPLSMMSRDELDKFCRLMLNHCVPKNQTRGRGSLALWEERFPVSALSSRTRALLDGDTVALADFRSWNPGMALGQKFKQGLGSSFLLPVEYRTRS